MLSKIWPHHSNRLVKRSLSWRFREKSSSEINIMLIKKPLKYYDFQVAETIKLWPRKLETTVFNSLLGQQLEEFGDFKKPAAYSLPSKKPLWAREYQIKNLSIGCTFLIRVLSLHIYHAYFSWCSLLEKNMYLISWTEIIVRMVFLLALNWEA